MTGKNIAMNVVKGLALPAALYALAGCAEAPAVEQPTPVVPELSMDDRVAQGNEFASEAGSTRATQEALVQALDRITEVVQDNLLHMYREDNQKGNWTEEDQQLLLTAANHVEEINRLGLLDRYVGGYGTPARVRAEFQMNERVLNMFYRQFQREKLGAVGAIQFNEAPGSIGFGESHYDFGGLDWDTVSEALDIELSPYQAVARAYFAHLEGDEDMRVPVQTNGGDRNIGTELWNENGRPNFYVQVDARNTNRGVVETDENGVITRIYDVDGELEPSASGDGLYSDAVDADLTKGLLYLTTLSSQDHSGTLVFEDAEGLEQEVSAIELMDYNTMNNGYVTRAFVAPILKDADSAEEYTNTSLHTTLMREYERQ